MNKVNSNRSNNANFWYRKQEQSQKKDSPVDTHEQPAAKSQQQENSTELKPVDSQTIIANSGVQINRAPSAKTGGEVKIFGVTLEYPAEYKDKVYYFNAKDGQLGVEDLKQDLKASGIFDKLHENFDSVKFGLGDIRIGGYYTISVSIEHALKRTLADLPIRYEVDPQTGESVAYVSFEDAINKFIALVNDYAGYHSATGDDVYVTIYDAFGNKGDTAGTNGHTIAFENYKFSFNDVRDIDYKKSIMKEKLMEKRDWWYKNWSDVGMSRTRYKTSPNQTIKIVSNGELKIVSLDKSRFDKIYEQAADYAVETAIKKIKEGNFNRTQVIDMSTLISLLNEKLNELNNAEPVASDGFSDPFMDKFFKTDRQTKPYQKRYK